MFARLKELGTKARMVLIYPDSWPATDTHPIGRQLIKSRDSYGVTLEPVKVLLAPQARCDTWRESYTKLMVFNLTEYERVVYMDCNGMVRKVIFTQIVLADNKFNVARSL